MMADGVSELSAYHILWAPDPGEMSLELAGLWQVSISLGEEEPIFEFTLSVIPACQKVKSLTESSRHLFWEDFLDKRSDNTDLWQHSSPTLKDSDCFKLAQDPTTNELKLILTQDQSWRSALPQISKKSIKNGGENATNKATLDQKATKPLYFLQSIEQHGYYFLAKDSVPVNASVCMELLAVDTQTPPQLDQNVPGQIKTLINITDADSRQVQRSRSDLSFKLLRSPNASKELEPLTQACIDLAPLLLQVQCSGRQDLSVVEQAWMPLGDGISIHVESCHLQGIDGTPYSNLAPHLASLRPDSEHYSNQEKVVRKQDDDKNLRRLQTCEANLVGLHGPAWFPGDGIEYEQGYPYMHFLVAGEDIYEAEMTEVKHYAIL